MLTIGAALVTGARAAKPAVEASRVAVRMLRRLGTFNIRWIDVGDGPALTAKEVEDLERFLGERESRGVLSVLATTLLTRESEERDAALEIVREFFMNSARRYRADHGSKWFDRRDAIWQSIIRIYDQATPAGQELAEAALEIEDFLRTPISRGHAGQPEHSTASRFVARLSELCGDIARVADALDNAERIRETIASLPTPPIITYTDAATTATFQDLYVRRTLKDKRTQLPIEDQLLTTKGAPYRAVVHGAPGTGKSTFVQNLRRELAADQSNAVPLLLTARMYFPAEHGQSVLQYLTSTVRTTVNFAITETQISDILTLGAATVIVDGLDEVTDIHLRVELVQRICAFAAEFPTVSILVTSRSIGYERAPLPETSFRTFTLDEYSPQQSSEYVRRWFSAISRTELASEFERESETIRDLKENPLLLSLLCILYRERGSIPRRRRQIYEQCADLLFHKWDSHRHIGQPEELHTNGDRIMQELARWVYTSPRAQNGLSESVITRSIGGYLRDALGVEEGEARRRAAEFLEFCATRAWLLGSTGTDHGERIFGFTHRTFFEFFAAESFSRTSGDPAKIAGILIDAHKRDNTSVLPELLLQAIDVRLDRGAAETFKRVCEQTDDPLLILRLMQGAPLPGNARTRGFDRIIDLSYTSRRVAASTSVALMTIDPDARGHFLRDYVETDRNGSSMLFLGLWASLSIQGDTSRFASDWEAAALKLGRQCEPRTDDWFRSTIDVWRWREAIGPAPTEDRYLLTASGVAEPVIGTLWLSFELAARRAAPGPDLAQVWAHAVDKAASPRRNPTVAAARKFTELVLKRLDTEGMPNASSWVGDQRQAYLYAVGIIFECIRHNEEAREGFLSALPSWAQMVCRQRASSVALREQSKGKARALPGIPVWLSEWVNAERSFVFESA